MKEVESEVVMLWLFDATNTKYIYLFIYLSIFLYVDDSIGASRAMTTDLYIQVQFLFCRDVHGCDIMILFA